ncbi:DUF6000 family protein [Streptomyces endocoffeicus]|uniref:DUF6000 family protein n=1 Tax=Streptomyces endocoffeicus TaxID=2898945 RepID=UPI00355629EB
MPPCATLTKSPSCPSRYLPRPDLHYDQAAALGTLLSLDTRLGTGQAARSLTPDGLWQQGIDGPPSKVSHGLPGVRRSPRCGRRRRP